MRKPKIEEVLAAELPNVIESDIDEKRYSQRPYEKEQESPSNGFDFQALQKTMFEHLETLDNQINDMQSKLNETLDENSYYIRKTQENIHNILKKMPK